MKLSFSQIQGFLQRPPAALRVALIFGPDGGLARERAEQIAKTVVADLQDPFRVVRLLASSVLEDQARLGDEIASFPFGGGRKLVWLQQAGDNLASPLGALLKDWPETDTLLLIEAGELDKRSKLRALCESDDPRVAAIPCYVEDGPARQRTIVSMLGAEGLDVPREVASHLADLLPPDQMAMRAELEKLALYMGPDEAVRRSKVLTIEDVQAVLEDTGATELDGLVMAVASGEAAKVAALLPHLWAEQVAPVAVLRAALRHFLRLRLAKAHVENGLGAESALKKLSPPVFWKQEAAMTRQVSRWSAAKLDRMIERLVEAEAAVKKTGTPDVALCSQLMMMASRG